MIVRIDIPAGVPGSVDVDIPAGAAPTLTDVLAAGDAIGPSNWRLVGTVPGTVLLQADGAGANLLNVQASQPGSQVHVRLATLDAGEVGRLSTLAYGAPPTFPADYVHVAGASGAIVGKGVFLEAGKGPNVAATGASLDLRGAEGGGPGWGGLLAMFGGDGTSNAGPGGDVTIKAGLSGHQPTPFDGQTGGGQVQLGGGQVAGAGGAAAMEAGNGLNGESGGYLLLSGAAGDVGGACDIAAGDGSSAGAGGAVTISAGAGGFGGGGHNGGALTINAGAKGGAGLDGILSIGGLNTRRVNLANATAEMGFFGTPATTKPAVAGSRGGNAALASLLTALANLGLITNNSTP